MVLNGKGQLAGPYLHEEWFEYSWFLWDLFFKLKNNPKEFIVNHKFWWSQIFFRNNEDFCADLYARFSPILMLMVNYLPTDYAKHRSYADCHSGSDLWENIKPVDANEAIPFRQHGELFNKSIPHKFNLFIRGESVGDLEQRRNSEKQRMKLLKSRIKDNDGILNETCVPDEDNIKSWYRPLKHIPMRIVNGKIQEPIFPNNERHIIEHWDTCIEGITKFLTSGAIKLMPEKYKPLLVTTFVLANADNELKKTRPCYDGGSFKQLEAYKTSCKLEGLPEILKALITLDKVTKLDDSQGFFLMGLNPESKDLACFQFGGRTFQYNALPFGERLSPSTFQRGNNIPINFLRSNGILITLYLDDRLVVEQASKYESYHLSENLEQLQDTALDTFLSLLIIVAGGGFVNMSKSIFKPTYEEQFLGMKINSKICEISIPADKWKRFQESLWTMIEAEYATLTELEVLRGTCASFHIASLFMKYFIREMTSTIKSAYKANKGKLHRLFKNMKVKINKHLKGN